MVFNGMSTQIDYFEPRCQTRVLDFDKKNNADSTVWNHEFDFSTDLYLSEVPAYCTSLYDVIISMLIRFNHISLCSRCSCSCFGLSEKLCFQFSSASNSSFILCPYFSDNASISSALWWYFEPQFKTFRTLRSVQFVLRVDAFRKQRHWRTDWSRTKWSVLNKKNRYAYCGSASLYSNEMLLAISHRLNYISR